MKAVGAVGGASLSISSAEMRDFLTVVGLKLVLSGDEGGARIQTFVKSKPSRAERESQYLSHLLHGECVEGKLGDSIMKPICGNAMRGQDEEECPQEVLKLD
jgi:hypothetical protein